MSKPIRMEVVRIEKRSKEYINTIDAIVDGVAKDQAEKVARLTRQLVPAGPYSEGGLSKQIKVQPGKFSEGDYFIEAQGPGDYSRFYASFLEMGSTIHPWGNKNITKHLPAQPYLRPALKVYRKKITAAAQRALNR